MEDRFKLNHRVTITGRFRLVLLLTCFLLGALAGQSALAAAIPNANFGQLDWFDSTGALHTPFSSW